MRRLIVVLGVLLAAGCGGSSGAARPTSTMADPAVANEPMAEAVRAAAARLPLVDITTSTAATDPNGLLGQPKQYVARVGWRDQRVRPNAVKGEVPGVESGGAMERFASAGDLAERKQSLEATLGLLVNTEVLFVHGLVLVRLPGTLAQPQAAEVDAALAAGLEASMPSSTTAAPTTAASGTRRTTRPSARPTVTTKK